MDTILKPIFDTRRDAEMTIERLMQEYSVDNVDIFIAAEGDENSVGEGKSRI